MHYIGLSVDYQEIQFGELIGRGCYGSVHKGLWRGETVALKRIGIPPTIDKTQMLANNQEIAALRYVSSKFEHEHKTSILSEI